MNGMAELLHFFKNRLTFNVSCSIIHFVRSTSDVYAIVAQLVERHLAKVETAGSSPVYRSLETASELFGGLFIWLIKRRSICASRQAKCKDYS